MPWSHIRYVFNSTDSISVLEAAAEGRGLRKSEGWSQCEREGKQGPRRPTTPCCCSLTWSTPSKIVLWVEGIIGTTIKDTWTKPRGRVERGEGGGFTWGGVGGWGEKAYNCH